MIKGKQRLVGTMKEMIEMKKQGNRSNEQFTLNMSSSQLDSPSSPQTRACQHVRSKSQENNLLNRPYAHSQGLNQEKVISQSPMHATSSRVPCATNSTAKQSTTIRKGRGPAQFPKIWGSETKKLKVTLNRKGEVIGPDVIQFKSALGCLARIGVKLPLNYVEFQYIPQYLRDMAWDEVEKIAAKNEDNVGKTECRHRTGRIPFAVLEQEFMMEGTDVTELDIWMESQARGKGVEDDDDTS